MSRLTRKNKSGEFYIPRRYEDENGNNVVLSNQDCINKLAHYEDLEEQGLLTVIDNETFQRDNLDRCTYRHCNKCDKYRRDLQRYKNLKEQGRLVELPCSVGDTVYLISSQYSECSKHQERFNEYSCEGCEDECDSHKEYFIHVNEDVSLEWIARAMRHNSFGNTVFHTKEGAEAKLAEMEDTE